MEFDKRTLHDLVLLGSAGGLVALNLYEFTTSSLGVATALILTTALFFKGFRIDNVAIYTFILAEISPIGMHASVPVAVTYQGLSFLLLAAMYESPDYGNRVEIYKKGLLRTCALVGVPIASFVVLRYAVPLQLSSVQTLSLSALILVLAVSSLIIIPQLTNRARAEA